MINTAYFDLKAISASVPHGSALGSVLFLLFTNDIVRIDGFMLELHLVIILQLLQQTKQHY